VWKGVYAIGEPVSGRSSHDVAEGQERALLAPQDRDQPFVPHGLSSAPEPASAASTRRVCLHRVPNGLGCPLVSLHPGASRCRSVYRVPVLLVHFHAYVGEHCYALVMCSRQALGNAPDWLIGGISTFSAWRKQAPGEGEEGNAEHSFVTPPGDFVRCGEGLNAKRINDRPGSGSVLHDRSGSLAARLQTSARVRSSAHAPCGPPRGI